MEVIVITTFLVIIGALSGLHFWTNYGRSGKLINKIPGPTALPIVGNILDLIVSVEALWYLLREYADTYYSIYRLWVGHRSVVQLRHPDDIEVLLSSQKHISKSFFYEFLHPWLKQGLLTSTGNKWHSRRKILTPTFHYKTLQEFVGVFIENSERMVKSLNSESDEVIEDLETFIAKYTLNNICETAMGTTLQEKIPVHVKYRHSIKQMGEILYYRSFRPWLTSDWIFSWTQKGKEQKELLNNLHQFTSNIIEKRKEYHVETGGKYLIDVSTEDKTTSHINDSSDLRTSKKKRLAMLDLLIAEQKQRGYIDDRGIQEEVDTFVFEGHDTTEMGLCFTLLLLAEHKEIQKRARAEIDSVMKVMNGKLGMKELQNLPYLERCIKEALRMYPSVPIVSRRINEDMQLKNFLIPGGTIVNVVIFDVHRDPNFWPEPHVYDPDRFEPERIQGRHPYSYIPFSAGPRNCIGQKFAMLELKSVVAMLLHNFYMEPVTPLSQIRLASNMILKPVQTLKLKFVPVRL